MCGGMGCVSDGDVQPTTLDTTQHAHTHAARGADTATHTRTQTHGLHKHTTHDTRDTTQALLGWHWDGVGWVSWGGGV